MLITPTQIPSPAPDHGYLLIEPANLPDDMRELLPETYPCVPPFLWASEASMPRLLKLDQLTASKQKVVSEMVTQAVSEEHPPVVCGWLQSDSDSEELANSIARLILGHAPDGGQVIWRYYDPRVFVLAAHLFNDEQGNALLGEVESWTFVWRRQWWCAKRTRSFQPSIADLCDGWPTNSQWEILKRSRLFSQVHERLHTRDATSAHCLDELRHSIEAISEVVRYVHLDSNEDCVEFAYFSTRYQKIFRTHHELLSRWEKLRNREITLGQMLRSITHEDIENMNVKFNETGVLK
ncbi:DUF4123 domain-containing protein [Pseudoduganella lutea]|uniref:DUF4123 domain-containing protein n=1 Tax=Pseudoduganella lutea TaxID=321985 RepID=A0A4V0Z3A2_9BURK|nr:DUF4123 domain-containing protein [Pseudoduganella lutea]QBE62733.1 DUF4123 domain-containing protein [Pseudoduganella lutea]